MSTLVVAWRTVLKRLAADWLILTAAVVTVVLATVLLGFRADLRRCSHTECPAALHGHG